MADQGQAVVSHPQDAHGLPSLSTATAMFTTTKYITYPGNVTSLVGTSKGNLVTRATFLAVFLIIAFISNCVLLATIAQSNRHKRSALNLFVINIAIVNLLDCIACMPLILGATITDTWDYGTLACNVNAFFVQLTSMVMVAGLFVLSVDRCVAVYAPARYPFTLVQVNCLIIYTWIHAAALSFPLIANLVHVEIFPAR